MASQRILTLTALVALLACFALAQGAASSRQGLRTSRRLLQNDNDVSPSPSDSPEVIQSDGQDPLESPAATPSPDSPASPDDDEDTWSPDSPSDPEGPWAPDAWSPFEPETADNPPSPDSPPGPDSPPDLDFAINASSVYEYISAHPSLTYFKAAVDILNLTMYLNESSVSANTTFFLPTDEAFSLTADALYSSGMAPFDGISSPEDLLNRTDLLREIVSYHVWDIGALNASDLPSLKSVLVTEEASEGAVQWLQLFRDSDLSPSVLIVTDVLGRMSTVVQSAVVANASINVIDHVLLPPAVLSSLSLTVFFNGDLQRVADFMDGDGVFEDASLNVTLFAPTNTVLDDAAGVFLDVSQDVFGNDTRAREILHSNMIAGGALLGQWPLVNGSVVQTLNPEAQFIYMEGNNETAPHLVGLGSIANQTVWLDHRSLGIAGTSNGTIVHKISHGAFFVPNPIQFNETHEPTGGDDLGPDAEPPTGGDGATTEPPADGDDSPDEPPADDEGDDEPPAPESDDSAMDGGDEVPADDATHGKPLGGVLPL